MNYKPLISTTTEMTLNERFEKLQDGLSHVELPEEYAFLQIPAFQQTTESSRRGPSAAVIAARKLKAKSVKERLGYFSVEHHVSKVLEKDKVKRLGDRAAKWRPTGAAAIYYKLYFNRYKRTDVTKEELDEDIEDYRRKDKRLLDKEIDAYMKEAKLMKEGLIKKAPTKDDHDVNMNLLNEGLGPLVIDHSGPTTPTATAPAPATQEDEKMDDDW